MKKKTLSLALVFALVLSIYPCAMAAELRETDFFEDQPHTHLSFDEIEYRHIDTEPILLAMDEIRALMGSEANEEVVSAKFDELIDQLTEMETMDDLTTILTSCDATNETYAEEYIYINSARLAVADAACVLIRELLCSPCAGFLEEQLSEADIAYYISYESMTDEELALTEQEQELITEYQIAALQPYTVEHGGQIMDEDAVYAAMGDGSLDEETGIILLTEIAQARIAALGEIFMRMIPVRNKIAEAAGYSNYGDYAYAEVYDRDYTPAEISAFRQAVKDYIGPVAGTFATLYNYEYDDPALTSDYPVDTALDMIEPCIAQMSSELAEALAFMRNHKMYDLAYGETKQDKGFTTMLSSYGAPFMFDQPNGEISDITAIIHELGHYNHFYWDSTAWTSASDSIDVTEVHSTGLELLLSHFYADLFGASADVVSDYLMYDMTLNIVDGCLFDELQQYIYATPNITIEQINAQYCTLAKEYGIIDAEDERTELYGWVYNDHTFTRPMYYISYAVSIAGAFSFWVSAQENSFEEAVDQYLSFVALPTGLGFQSCFEELGMADPLDASYVEELAAYLMENTQALERAVSAELSSRFSDLSSCHWYDEYVLAVVTAGLLSGYDDGTFRPDSTVTWSQALEQVLLLGGYEERMNGVDDCGALAWELGLLAPDFDLDSDITRQEMCRLLAQALELPVAETDSPFADTDDGYVLALTDLGIITGYIAHDGTRYFNGSGALKRSELCAILYRVMEAIYIEELTA